MFRKGSRVVLGTGYQASDFHDRFDHRRLVGFTGISAAAAGIAKVLFFILVVAFVIFLIPRQSDPEGKFACRPTAKTPQMIDRPDSPAYAVLRLNPVRSDWLYDNASELRSNQTSLRAGYRGCYAFRTGEGFTAPAPPRDRYSYLGQ